MISASEKCLYKNEPISVSLSFFFFAVFSICVWIHVCLYGWENNVSLCLLLCQRWWKGDGGRCSPLSVLFVHHSSVCHLRLFHPSARPVCLSTSFSQRCIMNVFFFYCLLLWIIPKAGKSPACPSQPECLDHTLSVWKQPITGPDRPGDWVSEPVHAWGNLGWIWIVFQMSSWINMAIHFKLEEDSNCTLSYLLSRRWFWFFFLL